MDGGPGGQLAAYLLAIGLEPCQSGAVCDGLPGSGLPAAPPPPSWSLGLGHSCLNHVAAAFLSFFFFFISRSDMFFSLCFSAYRYIFKYQFVQTLSNYSRWIVLVQQQAGWSVVSKCPLKRPN